MRGATRIQVHVVLAASGAITGALAGFAAGLLPIPPLGSAAPPAALVAVALDLARVRPPAVPRQVPACWGRIFGPRVAAGLYGARLGVGPLTRLPTWLWWAALLVGASRGPWAGAATGATFAVTRAVVMAVAGTAADNVHRHDGRVRAIVALVVGSVVLAGCSAGDDDPAGEPAATTIELVRPTTTTTTGEDRALADLLLDDALPGFVRDDDAVGAGPMDLDAAAAAEVDSDAERALLETRGFVRGVSRAWTGDGGGIVYVASYELASPSQADAYLVDGAETLSARGAETFDVPDVAGALGFTTREDGFVAHAVAFTRGERWFLVLVGSSDGTRTPHEAVELAVRQAARL